MRATVDVGASDGLELALGATCSLSGVHYRCPHDVASSPWEGSDNEAVRPQTDDKTLPTAENALSLLLVQRR